jgi:long-chain acyl-CoA synthetase
MDKQNRMGWSAHLRTAALTLAWPNDFSEGHVGYVVPCMEIKLVSVPEMNYHAKDLKGEVWVRGPAVFRGYLKDKKKTDETLTEDGWLQTGDIATLDKYG